MKLIPAIAFAAVTTLSLNAHALTTSDMIGESANGALPERVVKIEDQTRSVNVKQGDTVKIINGQDSVVWHFDGIQPRFPLSKILPSSPNAENVKVYVQIEQDG